ncbi:hypothetical protein GCM10027595_00600 [Corynebacterium nasicanis]
MARLTPAGGNFGTASLVEMLDEQVPKFRPACDRMCHCRSEPNFKVFDGLRHDGTKSDIEFSQLDDVVKGRAWYVLFTAKPPGFPRNFFLREPLPVEITVSGQSVVTVLLQEDCGRVNVRDSQTRVYEPRHEVTMV